jgi:hypothetical protein
VPDIEIGASIISTLANRVENERSVPLEIPSDPLLNLKARSIVEGMRPGVVEIEDKAAQALAE